MAAAAVAELVVPAVQVTRAGVLVAVAAAKAVAQAAAAVRVAAGPVAALAVAGVVAPAEAAAVVVAAARAAAPAAILKTRLNLPAATNWRRHFACDHFTQIISLMRPTHCPLAQPFVRVRFRRLQLSTINPPWPSASVR